MGSKPRTEFVFRVANRYRDVAVAHVREAMTREFGAKASSRLRSLLGSQWEQLEAAEEQRRRDGATAATDVFEMLDVGRLADVLTKEANVLVPELAQLSKGQRKARLEELVSRILTNLTDDGVRDGLSLVEGWLGPGKKEASAVFSWESDRGQVRLRLRPARSLVFEPVVVKSGIPSAASSR